MGILGAALLAGPAAAQTVVFAEDFSAVAPGSLPVDWVSISGNDVVALADQELPDASGSTQALALTVQASGGNVTLSPSIDFAAHAGQEITVSFDLYNQQSAGDDTSFLLGITTPSSRLEQSVATWVYGIEGVGAPYTSPYPTQGAWTTMSFDLSDVLAVHPDADGIAVFNWNGRGITGPVYLTNLEVTAVPEPSTGASLAGLAGLARVAWQRRRRARAGWRRAGDGPARRPGGCGSGAGQARA